MTDTSRTVQRRTATATFGSPARRVGHDSSAFYARFGDPVPSCVASSEMANVVRYPHRDEVRVGDARDLEWVPDNSVALVVTSPPYFCGREYEPLDGSWDNPTTWGEYVELLGAVIAEAQRILEPGGRIAINVANLGRRPYRSLSATIIGLLDGAGLLLRGEIIWRKAAGSSSTAYGTYRQPHNPVLRDLTERIIVASSETLSRHPSRAERASLGLPHEADISTEEWAHGTVDVWDIAPASARRIGHPAPFPIEMAARLIRLYTYRDDVVVDPMCGSGTTCVAAARLGRRYLGVDNHEPYVRLARQRLAAIEVALPFPTEP